MRLNQKLKIVKKQTRYAIYSKIVLPNFNQMSLTFFRYLLYFRYLHYQTLLYTFLFSRVDQLNNAQVIRKDIGIHGNDYPQNITLNMQLEEVESAASFTIHLYAILRVASVLLDFLKTYALFEFCRAASTKIHKTMVDRIVHSVMEFFDTHFIGNVLNRFSQDINNIDEMLPVSLNQGLLVSMLILQFPLTLKN